MSTRARKEGRSQTVNESANHDSSRPARTVRKDREGDRREIQVERGEGEVDDLAAGPPALP